MPELPQLPVQAGISLPGFAKPPIAPGAASRELGETATSAGEMITSIATRLNDINHNLQFNEAGAKYDTAADASAHAIMRDPKYRSDPIAATAEYQRQLADLADQTRQQYPMANFGARLDRNMALWSARKLDTLQNATFLNRIDDTRERMSGPAYTTALLASTDPTKDPHDREAIAQHYLESVDQAKSLFRTDAEAESLQNKFQIERQGRLNMNWAHANPGQALALQQPLPGQSWEQLQKMKADTVEGLESQGKGIDATVSAQRGALEGKIVQAVAAGQPVSGMLSDYMAHGGRQEFYEAFTGEQWIRSNPTAVNSFIDRIKTATPEEAPYILQEATMMRASQVMSSADLATVSSFAAKQREIGMTAQKAEEAQGWADVLAKYRAAGKSGIPDFGPKVDETRLRATWEAALLNNKHDVTKAKEAVDKQLGDYMRNGDTAVKGSINRLVPGVAP